MCIETMKPKIIDVYCDKIKFDSEPTQDEAREISERIHSNVFRIDCNSAGMPKFAYIVGRHGHSFCPVLSLYDPDTGFTFGEQQIFPLEFNGTTTFKEAANRAEQHHLPMLFAYRRFLSTQAHERFCVSFLLDTPVQTREGAWGVRAMLRTIFPESEMDDADLNKVFFGGNYSIFCNEAIPTITCEMLYKVCCQIQSNIAPPTSDLNCYSAPGNFDNSIYFN